MILASEAIQKMIYSPVRHIRARVELLNGSTLLHTFTCEDRLKSFTVERVGEGKFFGFGICQKLNVHLIDTNRELDITTDNTIEIAYGVDWDFLYPLPLFKVSEVHRDENTNELSITAYDWLYQAANYTVNDLEMPVGYSIQTAANIAAARIGLNCRLEGLTLDDSFYTFYPDGANLDGTETLRELFNAIAEATQTIYYVNNQWELVFKRLSMDGDAAQVINREQYFALESRTNRRLSAICHATELGDNLIASIKVSGSTQYVRDNPLWDMRDDTAQLLTAAIELVGGFTINQFDCSWRGNFLLEIGDRIGLLTKNGEIDYSYLLDDTVSYDGTYSQKTKWSYSENEAETEANPTTIGDAVKQTFARVDKVNREIELLASGTENNTNNISSLLLNTDSITATVQELSTNTAEAIDSVNSDITEINKKVEATMTAEDVKLEIQTEISNGVDKVVTSTGFTFDETGLLVEKTDSEMKTQITEDGMRIYKNAEEVLTANNIGVNAVNLHATTYLIIGTNSRLENYGADRTGCFWIGGN